MPSRDERFATHKGLELKKIGFSVSKTWAKKNERSKPSLVRSKIRGQKPTLKLTAKAPENGWFFQTIRLPFGGDGFLAGAITVPVSFQGVYTPES